MTQSLIIKDCAILLSIPTNVQLLKILVFSVIETRKYFDDFLVTFIISVKIKEQTLEDSQVYYKYNIHQIAKVL